MRQKKKKHQQMDQLYDNIGFINHKQIIVGRKHKAS